MIVVIGAGVCGLAAAYELSRRGERAIVLERGEPFAGQSAGLARIFRIAHRRPALCALALEARAGWQRWQAELGAGRLLGCEGFIAAGPREDTAAAMEAAGAAFSWLDRREIAARIPFAAPPWEHAVLDPLGGSLRIRRALAALAARVDIHRGEVASVAGDGSVTLADGTVVRADRVLICAGVQTPALFGPLGVEFAPHIRVTYAGRRRHRRRVPVRARGLRAAAGQHGALGVRAGGAGPRDRARAVPVAARRWARWTASRSAPPGWTPAATAGRPHAAVVSSRSSAAT